MKFYFKVLSVFLIFISLAGQNHSRQDYLRGSITKERSWWDLNYYDLKMTVDPEKRFISGTNLVKYTVLSPYQDLQIEMQRPMEITAVYQDGKKLKFKKDGYSHFIKLLKKQKTGDINEILIEFSGNPQVSVRPPWSGGITWAKDENGNHFVASSCQGEGASLWWPNKDHSYDEVDSMLMSITVPEKLTDVSNGRLRGIDHDKKNKTRTFHWFVSNPINNYGVNINIADYVHFSEKYKGEKGVLDCDYYVLSYNLDKAKKQFKDVKRTLDAFEHWFGPYPFYEDSYKLVEAPYLGMEHQSSVTYGNGYQNGYRGMDLSGTGWGLKFDFIIIHESGHEWFANNITNIDVADMWIHESFTAYSENLFLDYHYGKKASSDYVIGTRSRIFNEQPVIGPYNVNKNGADIYYKGANLLHTIRQLIDNDKRWRNILRGLNKTFYHQTVDTKQVEDFINSKTDVDLRYVFDQYLRNTTIPVLEYYIRNNTLNYRWANCITMFDMPVKVSIGKKKQWLYPKKRWKKMSLPKSVNNFSVDKNFYVSSFNILGD